MNRTIRLTLIYTAVAMLLTYYVAAAKVQYERTAELSYQLIDKKISKAEHSRLKKENTLLNTLQHPAAVFGID